MAQMITVTERDAKILANIIRKIDVRNEYDGALRYFLRHKDKLSDRVYWECLRAVWIKIGGVVDHLTFRRLFSSDRPQKHWLMTEYDRAQLSQLPNEIIIYRAALPENDHGLSWTTSKEFAEQYAEGKNRVVLTKTIKKEEIFAFLNSRSESEIILKSSLLGGAHG